MKVKIPGKGFKWSSCPSLFEKLWRNLSGFFVNSCIKSLNSTRRNSGLNFVMITMAARKMCPTMHEKWCGANVCCTWDQDVKADGPANWTSWDAGLYFVLHCNKKASLFIFLQNSKRFVVAPYQTFHKFWNVILIFEIFESSASILTLG